jgi:hypothetical protein
MFPAAPEVARPALIKLPRTAPRSEKLTYIKLIHHIRPLGFGLAFDGPILCPGALASRGTLGERPVIVECAGRCKIGRNGENHRSEYLYLLWRYDYAREEWIELGRARAADWTWSLALRELAIEALRPPNPRLVDVYRESERVAGKVCGVLDEELEWAVEGVKVRSLGLVYEQVAARIAAC